MRSLSLFLSTVLSLGSVSLGASAEESKAPTETEVGIRSILIAEDGWDNQQNVTAMVQGELPSVCHSLGRTEVTQLNWKSIKAFTVYQFVTRRTDGDCAPDSDVMHTQQTVPFSKPVQLGVLSAGEYFIAYFTSVNDESSGSVREFGVSASTLDPLLPKLAQVRAIEIPSNLQAGQPISVTLQGTLANPCVQISRMAVVQKNDTFVVSLTASSDPELVCTQQITPFSETIELTPDAKAGEFLIHAGVPGSAPVQRVFSISQP